MIITETFQLGLKHLNKQLQDFKEWYLIEITVNIFFFTEVYITDHLCTKNENSSFFKPKIHGLYTRAVSDQERVIMARVRYVLYLIRHTPILGLQLPLAANSAKLLDIKTEVRA